MLRSSIVVWFRRRGKRALQSAFCSAVVRSIGPCLLDGTGKLADRVGNPSQVVPELDGGGGQTSDAVNAVAESARSCFLVADCTGDLVEAVEQVMQGLHDVFDVAARRQVVGANERLSQGFRRGSFHLAFL